MYVYIKSEPNLWTVGFYNPQGNWISESDYDTPEEAAGRVNWLNGGHKKQDDIFDMSREEIEQYMEEFIMNAQ